MNCRRETDPSISIVHTDNNTVRNNDNNTVDAAEENRNKKLKKRKGRKYKSFDPTAYEDTNVRIPEVWGQAKQVTPQINNVTMSSRKNQTTVWPALVSPSSVPRVDSGLGFEMLGDVAECDATNCNIQEEKESQDIIMKEFKLTYDEEHTDQRLVKHFTSYG